MTLPAHTPPHRLGICPCCDLPRGGLCYQLEHRRRALRALGRLVNLAGSRKGAGRLVAGRYGLRTDSTLRQIERIHAGTTPSAAWLDLLCTLAGVPQRYQEPR